MWLLERCALDAYMGCGWEGLWLGGACYCASYCAFYCASCVLERCGHGVVDAVVDAALLGSGIPRLWHSCAGWLDGLSWPLPPGLDGSPGLCLMGWMARWPLLASASYMPTCRVRASAS